MLNPKLRGWFNYYGQFNPSALRPLERHVGQSLVRWACRKYKKLRGHRVRAWGWLVLSPDSRLFWLSGSDNAARFSPWEPYESRGSRTVLEGPWGATPWGYLTSFRLVREQNLALALAVVSKIFSRKALRSNFNLCGAVGGPASQRCNNSFLRASLHI